MSKDDEVPMAPHDLRERLTEEPDGEELSRVWGLMEAGRSQTPADGPALEGAWNEVRRRLDDRSPSRARKARPRRTLSRRIAPWLAAAAVLIATAAVLFSARRVVTVDAPPGGMTTARLPDGSTIELNSGSRITYARRFGRSLLSGPSIRTVVLEGEAFFDVVSGEAPFVVETFNAQVRVVGTSFNVRARSDDEGTTVTVTSGEVEVVPKDATARTMLLRVGERGVVSLVGGGPVGPMPARLDRATVWRNGGFSVVDQPLAAIVRELEVRYDVEIRLLAERARNDSLTLYYTQPAGVRSIINDVCTARELNFRETSRGFEIY